MAGVRVRVWFVADGLGVGRRVVLLASPDPEGAIAVLVCAPG
jgi:hypothetical protein